MVSMYTRRTEECTGEGGRARHTRVQSPHTLGHGGARRAAPQGQAAKGRGMVARPNVSAGVVRTGGRGCQIPVARGAPAIPCEASKPMCERKDWHKIGERPRAAVGRSTWGVDEVGGGTHSVGQR